MQELFDNANTDEKKGTDLVDDLVENDMPADGTQDDESIDYSTYGTISEEQELANYNPYEHIHDLLHILSQATTNSVDGIILLATKSVLEFYTSNNATYHGNVLNIMKIWTSGVKIHETWIYIANIHLNLLNQNLPREQRLHRFTIIPERGVALLLMATGEFRLSTNVYGEKNGILMRQRAGYDIGTWVLQGNNSDLDRLINILNGKANDKYRKEVKNILMTELEPYENTTTNTIVRLHDGVYDCMSKEFTPYVSDQYDEKYGHLVSESKLYGVNWTEKSWTELEKECNILNIDGTIWSPIQGLIELVGDGIALQALREILHFAIRHMSGGFAWWFLNTSGNSAGGGGKSTFIQIVKNLVGGERNALTKSYDHLGDRFALVGLERKYVIVSDETEGANKKPDDTSVYKALITNGEVNIDVKHEREYSIRWSGVMIQAINGIPLFSDNSDSTYRRFLALPWERKLTQNGRKRDYIRDYYINNSKVIQCYLKWALDLGCLSTYSPEVVDFCLPYVELMKSGVKTVYEFMPEMMRRIQDENYFDGMNEVGRNFLYALYCKWDEVDNCVRNHISQKKFWLSVCEWVQSHPNCGWETTDNTTHIYPNTPFQKELVDYDLGPQWCSYSSPTSYGNRTPNGFFSCQNKTIRCGLLRTNKLPRNTNPNGTQGNPTQNNT